MLEIEDIHVNRGGTHAVRGLSLTVGRGEIVSLIGANGAGKTTTLSAVSGLLRPRKGRILYRPDETTEAIDLTAMKAEQIVAAGISHCPEARQIFGNLTVTENLRIGAYLRRDADGVAKDLADIHRRFPILEERGSVPGDKLSGGEQMMLAIGRALMSRPKLILFDEPSLGLAPILVEQIFDILEAVRADGVTVLLVEQNAAMALDISDRAYVIEAGEITLSGTGSELASNTDVQRAYLGAA